MAPEIEDPEEPGWGQLEPSLNDLPVAPQAGQKRVEPPRDENSDPTVKPPEPKQPRVVDVDLQPADQGSEKGIVIIIRAGLKGTLSETHDL